MNGTIIITPGGGEEIWQPGEAELERIRELASLRYKLSQIALLLRVPETELRRQVRSTVSPAGRAYYAGKLETETKYRQTVREKAEKGEQWAVEMSERWAREQTKEELGLGE